MCNTKSRNMTFGQALNMLDDGYCVHRRGLINVLITKQVPSSISEDIVPKMTSLNAEAKKIILSTCKCIHYNNQMLIVNLHSGYATQYMPDANDLAADDWEVIDDNVLKERKEILEQHFKEN